jgi:hypothetical protein
MDTQNWFAKFKLLNFNKPFVLVETVYFSLI